MQDQTKKVPVDPKVRTGFILAGILSVLAVALNVILIVLSGPATEILFRVIGVVSAVVLGCAALYMILNVSFSERAFVALKLKRLASGKKGKEPRNPGFFRRFFSDILLYLAISFLLAVVWTFVWNVSTAVPASEKIVVYVSATSVDAAKLSEKLTGSKPENIRRVEVRDFSYALFDGSDVNKADLFIFPESLVRENEALLSDVSLLKSSYPDGVWYESGNKTLGLLIREAGGSGPASSFIRYEADPDEAYYVCVNGNSSHVSDPDAAAFFVLSFFLKINN